ncbi:hypothetical protein FJY63_08475, partial [Candidatus Sumerlaeota bacterium]|nr:hypothetical protein [Candidatus Sumerlaeota bacterium]
FPVLVQGSSIWPGQWYFRRLRTIAVEGPMPPDAAIRQLPVLVLDEYLDDPAARKGSATLRYPWLLSDYVVRRVPFREWWRQEKLLETTARLADIWMALVPAQYRAVVPLTDSTGRPTGWIGDRDRLPNMTVEEEIRASKAVWRAVCDYLVYRRDFDPYRAAYPSRDHQSVLLCVKKDLHKKWLTQGGRHLPARTRFVRGPQ